MMSRARELEQGYDDEDENSAPNNGDDKIKAAPEPVGGQSELSQEV